MMNRALGILRNTVYFLFSIILISNCSDPPRKGISVTASGNKPDVHSISISDMKFDPGKVVVHKGDTVIWINHDIVAHCVTEIPDKSWTSSEIPPEGSWKMVVTKSSDYYCSIHPVMKGKIVMN
jgi:plastocyanin